MRMPLLQPVDRHGRRTCPHGVNDEFCWRLLTCPNGRFGGALMLAFTAYAAVIVLLCQALGWGPQ